MVTSIHDKDPVQEATVKLVHSRASHGFGMMPYSAEMGPNESPCYCASKSTSSVPGCAREPAPAAGATAAEIFVFGIFLSG